MAQIIAVENLKKRDNKKWKVAADFFLYTLPFYLSAIMAVPIPDKLKMWINFAVTIAIVTIKGFSKFTTESDADVAKDKQEEKVANDKLDDIKQQQI
jgi:hypothetical protein